MESILTGFLVGFLGGSSTSIFVGLLGSTHTAVTVISIDILGGTHTGVFSVLLSCLLTPIFIVLFWLGVCVDPVS
jgi:MFS superfamily sulfate permease-like transporter